MNDFLRGAVVMASLSIGLFFFRYWRRTDDRLFSMFGVAFWLLALNWTLASLGDRWDRTLYIFRFAAFVVIAIAVLDKNRRQAVKK